MFRFEFTDDELKYIKSKIHFTEKQERIIAYRQDELPLLVMADKEHVDVSTISRELRKIDKKIKKVI